ncbi:MAG: POT family MFS transporter [Akkermansiaceae bacterium]
MSQEYRSTPTETTGMPGGIPYIIANEAAERFSFYGMKGILVIFMSQYLWLMGDVPGEKMSQAEANEYYHLFGGLVYFTPFLGALLADIFWGKYKTIIVLSLVYVAGHAALAFMGVMGSAGTWLAIGLGLICIGSGGIKPCVSAHVGDQFGPSNSHLLTKIFNWFYFSINLGSTFSTLLIPVTLEKYGPHWAFGVPGALMALATLVFWMGRHKFIHVPPGGSKFAKELFSKTGLGALIKLIPLYLFVSAFWMLFDQTGSSWIFQAQDMDRQFLGHQWLPSQVQTINPILILILVPLFSFVIYPTVGKFIKLTPLRKMGAGLFLTVFSFAIIAGIQIAIENGDTPNIGWQLFAFLIITAAEVMVSIVCLEYSYTQAPKNMKSFVMAVFFFSVFLGNFIAAAVNRSIQIDDPTSGFVVSESKEATIHPGMDKKEGTNDDIILAIKNDVKVIEKLPSSEPLDKAFKLISDWTENNGQTLPTTEEAEVLLKGINDTWGTPLAYKRVASQTARLYSFGPDKTMNTQWDIGYELKTESSKPSSSLEESTEQAKSWLEKRKELLEVEEFVKTSSSVVQKSAFTGGQSKLEGPSYFWFFTGLMLASSILFVPYAIFVKEQSFIQSASDAEPQPAE